LHAALHRLDGYPWIEFSLPKWTIAVMGPYLAIAKHGLVSAVFHPAINPAAST